MMNVLSKQKKEILLGNEAIVRGALEAGVQFVSTYPGTPSSEIGNTFYHLFQTKKYKGYFEFSTNEKVALEAGIGASFSGLTTLVAMKHFGLNVCSDALLPFVYTGTKGPTVIVVADDPSCHSSAQSEQNTRAFGYFAHIPILEPSDPQECKDFVKIGFEISQKFEIPVMIRTTTRVSHQRSQVKLNQIKPIKKVTGKFLKNPNKFITMPPRVLEMKKELLEKLNKIKEFFENSKINKEEFRNFSKQGIITSGVSYLYVKEALKELKVKIPILKLSTFYPFPEKKIEKFIKHLNKVLVVEELEGYIEKEVKILAKKINCKIEVQGKDKIPEVGELNPEIVTSAISQFIERKWNPKLLKEVKNLNIKIPKRTPQLCPGCPYWLVFAGIKKALNPKKVIFGGDIGCYMLAGLPPHFLQDYLSCMGSSIGIAHGIKKSTSQKVIALIGDSTFFHAGIPPLINTVFNDSNVLIIIMNNLTTAMTGHQPHPGWVKSKGEIDIERLVRGCGVENVKTLDPLNQKEFVKTIKDFLKKRKVSVIIARHPCVFVKKYFKKL